jgi:hypothetical protein
MYREEDQRAEIEKIQRAVNESLRARRAFRVAKKQGRVVQTRPIVPTVERQYGTSGAEADTPEAFRAQPLLNTEPLQLQQVQGSKLPVPFPVPDPWPTTFTDSQQWSFLDDALNIDNNLNLDTTPPFDNILNLDVGNTSTQSTIPHSTGNGISYPFVFYPGAPPAENASDLEMIMNYLDNIFPLQYYFYQPSATERGRGWLLSSTSNPPLNCCF